MKKIFKYVLYICFISLVAFVACEPDPEVPLTLLIINQEIVEPSFNSVELTCDLTSNFTIDYVWAHVSLTPDFSQLVNKAPLVAISDGIYNGQVDGLEEYTTYYICYEIKNIRSSYMHNQVTEFQTFSRNLPAVVTKSVTGISLNGARVDGTIKSDGGYAITERGVCYSKVANPTVEDDKMVSGDGLGDFSCYLLHLEEGTNYHVRSYAINEKGVHYGRDIQFTTLARTFHQGYEYVDLGLSVRWATSNLGESLPLKYGDYYAWGETAPKENYTWQTYKWSTTNNGQLAKYNTMSEKGTVDNKQILDLSDDAAHVNWGGDWRMPTAKEINELYQNCKWHKVDQGYNVTSEINGNTIFLPAAGCMNGNTIFKPGEYGYYWSSEIVADEAASAYVIYFNTNGVYNSRSSREKGCFIRPVYPK